MFQQSYDETFQNCDTTSGSVVTPFSVKDILNMSIHNENDFFVKKEAFEQQNQCWMADSSYYGSDLTATNNCYYPNDDSAYCKGWSNGSYNGEGVGATHVHPLNSMYTYQQDNPQQSEIGYEKIESPSKYGR